MAFAQNGDLDSAIVACQTARALSSGGPFALGGLGYVLARAGRGPDAERVLDELQRFAVQGRTVPFDMSLVWMGLAKGDRTLEWIDKARRTQPSGVKDLGVDPRFDPLREDPRFRKILRELGLG
jgi:Flp pilus assembly protein TadD